MSPRGLFMPTKKRCPKCFETLPISEFHRCRPRPDGVSVYCKHCRKGITASRSGIRPTPDQKRCARCGVGRPPSDFSKNRSSEDGLQRYCRVCEKAYREQHPKDPRQERNYRLLRKFGLSVSAFDEILFKQGGCCAICRSNAPRGSGAFHVDHNHLSGEVRGLLCSQCNQGLGLLKDTPATLARAAQYLKRPNTAVLHTLEQASHREAKAGPYRRRDLKKKFGISQGQWLALLEHQGGQCAVCGSSQPGGIGAFHVDHNHSTGKVRGLLCMPCNLGIGAFKDSSEVLSKAVAYLERFKCPPQ